MRMSIPCKVINEWLDASPDNKKIYSQIREVWLNRSELKELNGRNC